MTETQTQMEKPPTVPPTAIAAPEYPEDPHGIGEQLMSMTTAELSELLRYVGDKLRFSTPRGSQTKARRQAQRHAGSTGHKTIDLNSEGVPSN